MENVPQDTETVKGGHTEGEIRFRSSPTLGKLAAALSAAQAAFPSIEKGRTAQVDSRKGEGSSYSYNYADLADVLAAVRPHLAANGLAIVQPIAWNGDPWLITRLIHSSDEWIESMYKLAEYDRPQDMGSAITYARRYALTALLGIAAEEDDDGARAQGGKRRGGKKATPPCPDCGVEGSIIKGKAEYGGGWVCWKNKGGCGHKFRDDDPRITGEEPQEREPGQDDEIETSEGPVKVGSGQHAEKAGAKDYEKAPPRKIEGPTMPCPKCKREAGKAKYPKPGQEMFCGHCREVFSA